MEHQEERIAQTPDQAGQAIDDLKKRSQELRERNAALTGRMDQSKKDADQLAQRTGNKTDQG